MTPHLLKAAGICRHPWPGARPARRQPRSPSTRPCRRRAGAQLERAILSANGPACREFFRKHYDDRGYPGIPALGRERRAGRRVRELHRWPELHALGADDEILRPYTTALEGMTRQYSGGENPGRPRRTQRNVRQGVFSPIRLDAPRRRAAALQPLALRRRTILRSCTGAALRRVLHGRGSDAPNYDRARKLIRSMMNGSTGPMLRPATALDWVGDPVRHDRVRRPHGENSHARSSSNTTRSTDVVGGHFSTWSRQRCPRTRTCHRRVDIQALDRRLHGRGG